MQYLFTAEHSTVLYSFYLQILFAMSFHRGVQSPDFTRWIKKLQGRFEVLASYVLMQILK
jgi:hypothetical protein